MSKKSSEPSLLKSGRQDAGVAMICSVELYPSITASSSGSSVSSTPAVSVPSVGSSNGISGVVTSSIGVDSSSSCGSTVMVIRSEPSVCTWRRPSSGRMIGSGANPSSGVWMSPNPSENASESSAGSAIWNSKMSGSSVGVSTPTPDPVWDAIAWSIVDASPSGNSNGIPPG